MEVVSVCQGYICIHDSELVDGTFAIYLYYVSYPADKGIQMYTGYDTF